MAYATGLRASDVVALKVGDIAVETMRTIAAAPKHLGAQIGMTMFLHTKASLTFFMRALDDSFVAASADDHDAAATE